MSQEQIVIPIGDKMVKLTVTDFDTDIDTDELLQVDINNILGDIITFPVLFNRIALLKADMEEVVARAKLDMDLFEAQLSEEKRTGLIFTDEKGKTQYPTIVEVANAVKMDAKYQSKKKAVFTKVKHLGYIEALYWSAKSKDGKLDRISEKIRPEEFVNEIIEGEINGVMIKIKNKTIR